MNDILLADKAIKTLLNKYSFQTVLDIGCGQGLHSTIFRQNLKTVIGIDASTHWGTPELVADFLTHTFSEPFDLVWCSHVLEHQPNVQHFIMLPAGGHRSPFGVQHLIPTRDEHGILHSPADLILDGPAVLSFSTQRVPPAVQRLLEYAQLDKEQVDYFVFHQANRMINETIRKKLGLPAEKVPSSLHDLGNTSGASLPVTMTARLHEQLGSGKHKLLLSGFGIGLSWGTAILDIEGAKFPAMLEA